MDFTVDWIFPVGLGGYSAHHLQLESQNRTGKNQKTNISPKVVFFYFIFQSDSL